MKKILFFLFVLLPMMASAYSGDVNIDGITYYVITESNWASVKGLEDKTLKTVTIPATITVGTEVCKVREIGEHAFYSTDIECVNIGSNVTTIGAEAFRNSQLTSITLSDQHQKIGDYAFANTKLTTITLPANIRELGKAICMDCKNLQSVTLYCAVGSEHFVGCSCLKSVTFHIYSVTFTDNNTVEEVILGSEVNSINFMNLTNLKGIRIPDNVTTIQSCCFSGTAVRSVYIPKTVKKINAGAFWHCPLLQELYLPSNKVLYTITKFTGEWAVIKDCPNLTDVYMYLDEWEGDDRDGRKIIDLPDRKAYLRVHPNQLNNYMWSTVWNKHFKKVISMTEDELATDITPATYSESIQSSDYYTLSGQRITNPKRGIYIQGGRKVVVK